MHAARHYYASALLEDGVNVRAVAEYHLGHNDPGFTLHVYAHAVQRSPGCALSGALASRGAGQRVAALDVVVEVELGAAVRLGLAGFASAFCEPLASAYLRAVIRLRSVRTSRDRSGC
jgi:hypothetical protein